MANLTVKKGEDGKYGFVDDAGNWVIEPKLLKAFVWNELGVVHFEEQNEDGTYDGWTIFKLEDPSEYNERTDDKGMGGDYGWYDHMNEPEDDDAEYIEAWNECGDSIRIYPDGKILCDDEFEDDEDWDEEDE